MTGLHALWLPVVVGAVLVFFASSVLHMLTGWHKSDYPKLPQEDAVMAALRPLDIPAGDYLMPCPSSREEMMTPEFKAKFERGPRLMMTVFEPGPHKMGKQLATWFLYLLVIGLFSGYIAGRALPPGASYLDVFRFVGATAFLGYGAALWQNTIWYQRATLTTVKSSIDSLLYALLTAGAFGWLWPR